MNQALQGEWPVHPNEPPEPAAGASRDITSLPTSAAGTSIDDIAKHLADKCVCGHVRGHHQPDEGRCAVTGSCDCGAFWKHRPNGSSNNTRSMAKMHNVRYVCQVVEHRLPRGFTTKDLYGFIDILCVRGEEIVGVQTTSWAAVKTRVDKITGHENYDRIKHAIRIVVHGWKKVAGRWICKEVEL